MDALLGAAGAGDIGRHFPDTDMRYKNISSLVLLERVMDYISADGWEVGNVDAVIIAQAPKMASYIEQMRQNIAGVLRVAPELVNVKATTPDRLGFAGRGEGIAAQAVACIYRVEP
jgi:2-C-methyl-D-erythritol 2,4-cyclodiphosphate synthase